MFHKEENRRKSIEKTAENLKSIRERFPVTLTGPTAIWKSFPRQQEALAWAASLKDGAIYSFEEKDFGLTGQRHFIVTSHEAFFHYYKQLSDKERHHYELLKEGSPVKMYLDLEFQIASNPTANGQVMREQLCKLLVAVFNCVYDQPIDDVCNDDFPPIVMTSSSDVKFSEHVIFPEQSGLVFRSTLDAGRFVYFFTGLLCLQRNLSPQREFTVPAFSLCSHCQAAGQRILASISSTLWPTRGGAAAFFVRTHTIHDGAEGYQGAVTTCFDRAVYTANRNFRLCWSSKLAKGQPLLPWPDTHQPMHFDYFLQTLAGHVKYPSEAKAFPPWKDFPCYCRSRVGHSNRLKDSSSRLHQPSMEGMELEETLSGYGKTSPYPEIDSYLLETVLPGTGTRGSIRKWTYFVSIQLLLYEMAHNRFCRRIDREHKSNNVMYFFDLKRLVWYQKCHDPDCAAADYRSSEFPIPATLLPWLQFTEELE